MLHFFRLPTLSGILFGVGLLLRSPVAHAQAVASATAAHGYDFLTVTTMESAAKSLSKLLIVPTFQGKSEAQLEDFGGMSVDKNIDKLQRNTQLVNQQLSELTVAGWELVDVHVVPVGVSSTTRYLFRKAKN